MFLIENTCQCNNITTGYIYNYKKQGHNKPDIILSAPGMPGMHVIDKNVSI
jgi:hypothetical protein